MSRWVGVGALLLLVFASGRAQAQADHPLWSHVSFGWSKNQRLARGFEIEPRVLGGAPDGQPSNASPGAQERSEERKEEKRIFKVYWDAGLHLTGRWENLNVKIGGDLQNDTAGFKNVESAQAVIGAPIEANVQWRRARVYAAGSVQRHLDFEFRYDFAGNNPPRLKDAYVDLVNLPIPTLELAAGRFKAPLGLDGYTGADDTVFLERSLLSTTFLPTRNTGFLLHGHSERLRIRWSVGALQPETDDLSLKKTDNLGYSGRFAAAFHPDSQRKTLVHLGLNVWRRNVEDTIRLATRPESHIAPNFVDTGEILSDHLDMVDLEAGLQRGALTIQSETALSKVRDTSHQTLLFHAFYVQGSYFLTGETRPYRAERGVFSRPTPKRELGGGGRSLGALELGFRFSHVNLTDGAVIGGRLDDWSFAFNWYPIYHAQVMTNFIIANRTAAKPVAIFQMRLQVAF
jgi:phosphate-selective porin OprO/OprP